MSSAAASPAANIITEIATQINNKNTNKTTMSIFTDFYSLELRFITSTHVLQLHFHGENR